MSPLTTHSTAPRTRLRRLVVVVAAVLLIVGAAACGRDNDTTDTDSSGADETSASTSTTAVDDLSGNILVAAAASLTDAFEQIGDDFEEEHPDVDITFTFDSSSTLATQILDGAPADVFASADERNMSLLGEASVLAGDPEVFATNGLMIITKPDNPAGIETLADLADVGVVALCAESAPCGRYADEVLAAAGVTIPSGSVTRSPNASSTLTAVTEGDAVAGIVYASDAVRADGAVEAVEIPADQNAIASYPIGILASTEHADEAAAFVAYVTGEAGQRVLRELGFLPAP